jgi:hypothetical protein
MTTKLSSAFKRELDLKGEKYTLTVAPEGLKLVQKGKRKGIELAWSALVNGEAALATALNASLAPPRKAYESLPGHGFVRYPTKH